MRLRLASTADVAQLVGLMGAVYSAFGEEPPPPERLATLFDDAISAQSLDVVVAESDGTLVGMVSIALFPTTLRAGRAAWIDDLHVVEGHRGRGLARTLLDLAMAHARDRGAVEIRLSADPEDPILRRLYGGAGFAAGPLQLLVRRESAREAT